MNLYLVFKHNIMNLVNNELKDYRLYYFLNGVQHLPNLTVLNMGIYYSFI